jgi:hypothetical protein
MENTFLPKQKHILWIKSYTVCVAKLSYHNIRNLTSPFLFGFYVLLRESCWALLAMPSSQPSGKGSLEKELAAKPTED